MKWIILGVAILLLLPFYVFVLSKSATMGRIQAMKLFKNNKDNGGDYGKEEEK
jgi:hypothetical protein